MNCFSYNFAPYLDSKKHQAANLGTKISAEDLICHFPGNVNSKVQVLPSGRKLFYKNGSESVFSKAILDLAIFRQYDLKKHYTWGCNPGLQKYCEKRSKVGSLLSGIFHKTT